MLRPINHATGPATPSSAGSIDSPTPPHQPAADAHGRPVAGEQVRGVQRPHLLQRRAPLARVPLGLWSGRRRGRWAIRLSSAGPHTLHRGTFCGLPQLGAAQMNRSPEQIAARRAGPMRHAPAVGPCVHRWVGCMKVEQRAYRCTWAGTPRWRRRSRRGRGTAETRRRQRRACAGPGLGAGPSATRERAVKPTAAFDELLARGAVPCRWW